MLPFVTIAMSHARARERKDGVSFYLMVYFWWVTQGSERIEGFINKQSVHGMWRRGSNGQARSKVFFFFSSFSFSPLFPHPHPPHTTHIRLRGLFSPVTDAWRCSYPHVV